MPIWRLYTRLRVTIWKALAALALPNVLFLGAYLKGDLAGCGAVKIMHDDSSYGEIKRVYVLESFRGRGVSKQLMQALETHLDRATYPAGTAWKQAFLNPKHWGFMKN